MLFVVVVGVGVVGVVVVVVVVVGVVGGVVVVVVVVLGVVGGVVGCSYSSQQMGGLVWNRGFGYSEYLWQLMRKLFGCELRASSGQPTIVKKELLLLLISYCCCHCCCCCASDCGCCCCCCCCDWSLLLLSCFFTISLLIVCLAVDRLARPFVTLPHQPLHSGLSAVVVDSNRNSAAVPVAAML